MRVALVITVGDPGGSAAPVPADLLTEWAPRLQLTITTRSRFDELRDALDLARRHADVVVVTTGLDATVVDAVAAVTGVGLTDEPGVREGSGRSGETRQRAAPESQFGRLPPGVRLIDGVPFGVPAFELEVDGCRIVLLPREASTLRAVVETWLARGPVQPTAILRSVGLTEDRIREFVRRLGPSSGIRFTVTGAYPEARFEIMGEGRAETATLEAVARVREFLGHHLYSETDEPLVEAVGRLCVGRGATVAVAESCTGGLLGAAFTEVAGSSAYFLGGALTYSNAEKTRALGVPEAVIASNGAVSEPVARAMAEGIRVATGASHALSITGVAGPGGGSPAKPVGTVWIGLAFPGATSATRYSFLDRSRREVRRASVTAALDLLRRSLLEPS